MCTCTHMPWHVYRGQRTTFRSWLSSSTMVVPGMEFRLSGLVASIFIEWTIFPAQFFSSAQDKNSQIYFFYNTFNKRKKVEPEKNDLRKKVRKHGKSEKNTFEWSPSCPESGSQVGLRGIMSKWLWDTLLSSWGEEEVHLSFNRWF